MNDLTNAFDTSSTPALDYGFNALDTMITRDAMDNTHTSSAGNSRNSFNLSIAVLDTLDPNSWLSNSEKVRNFRDLQIIASSNCRVLYCSNRNRFYDITISYDKVQGFYGAYLVVTIDGQTKPIRKALNKCPVEATRIIVDELQKDTALLFTKYDVGDKFDGQQGARSPSTGKFELYVYREREKKPAQDPEDKTRDMQRPREYNTQGGNRGNGANGNSGDHKRARYD